jgi:hypothetical protein
VSKMTYTSVHKYTSWMWTLVTGMAVILSLETTPVLIRLQVSKYNACNRTIINANHSSKVGMIVCFCNNNITPLLFDFLCF